jgi:peptidoglycan/xylan/chitin deacetylase (PgdA/CDA1 family)
MPQRFLKRRISFFSASPERPSVGEVTPRVLRRRFRPLANAGSFLLRLLHACPAGTSGPTRFEVSDLADFSEGLGCSLLVTAGIDSQQALDFVCKLRPDLGVIYGTVLPKAELCAIPRLGSIRVCKNELPISREDRLGKSPNLEKQGEEIRATIHRVDTVGRSGSSLRATSIPIEPYDTLASLTLKSNLLANDLLVRSVADFARGTVGEEESRSPGTREPQGRAWGGKQIASRRPTYQVKRGRPVWKLLLRTLLFGPFLVVRNWIRRLRGSFPVVILYHHVVTDRAHHLGIPTELFFKHVNFLSKHYKLVSLTEAIDTLERGKIKAPTVVLTFDDGYLDNYINLRAVTEEMSVPATLFVCTEHVTSQKEFEHDLSRGQHGFLPLRWEQVMFLSQKGFEIGSHTRSHFDCGSTDATALELEIVGSKTDLEHRLGSKVKFFSFPWGHPANMSAVAVDLARATYPHIFSASGGQNFPSPRGQLWHLKRTPHPNDLWELELALQSVLNL